MSSPSQPRPSPLLGLFERFRSARSPDPYERAVAELERGRPAEALALLEAALLSASDDTARALIHNKCGVALIELGRRDEALEAFCTALDCDAACATALVNLGNLFYEAGDLADAVDYYKAALRVDERSALAHENLAAAYKRLGDRAAAVRELRAAARLAGKRSPRRA